MNGGSGHGRQRVDTAGKTQPAEQGTAGGHSRQTLRPAQALTTTASGWPALQQKNNSCGRCWPASCRVVQVGGGSAVVLAARKAGSDLPNRPNPTYRLCLSLSLPTPLICKTQFSPKLTLFLCFYFYPLLPTITRPLTPFNVNVRLTYSL